MARERKIMVRDGRLLSFPEWYRAVGRPLSHMDEPTPAQWKPLRDAWRARRVPETWYPQRVYGRGEYAIFAADDASTPAPSSVGTKVGLGLGVVAVAAGVGYLLWSKKAVAAPAMQSAQSAPSLPQPAPRPAVVASPAPAPVATRPAPQPTFKAPPGMPTPTAADYAAASATHGAAIGGTQAPAAIDMTTGTIDPGQLSGGGAAPPPVQMDATPNVAPDDSGGGVLDYLKNAAQSAADLVSGS